MVNSNIIVEGNPFEELILIDNIPSSKNVYMLHNGIKFMEIVKSQWIGSLETIEFMKSIWTNYTSKKVDEVAKYNKTNRWGISVWIEGKEED